jgi:hypothetical protein
MIILVKYHYLLGRTVLALQIFSLVAHYSDYPLIHCFQKNKSEMRTNIGWVVEVVELSVYLRSKPRFNGLGVSFKQVIVSSVGANIYLDSQTSMWQLRQS